MEATLQVGKRAAQLRRDFDSSFANPPPVAGEAVQDLLAIRLGARRFALRLSEIAGLYADKRITPVPGAAAGMLGIAGFRGSILPVYDLQRLLDLSSGSASRSSTAVRTPASWPSPPGSSGTCPAGWSG